MTLTCYIWCLPPVLLAIFHIIMANQNITCSGTVRMHLQDKHAYKTIKNHMYRISMRTKQLRIMVTDLERPLAFIKEHFQLIYQLKNHITPIQNQTNCQKPSKKPKLLAGKINILKHPIFKILPSQHCLIKDIRLRQIAGLTCPHVLAKIKLTNPRCNIPNLPSLETSFHQLLSILLLKLP